MAYLHKWKKTLPLLGRTQIGWKVGLSHKNVKAISAGTKSLSGILGALGASSALAAVILAASFALDWIDDGDGVRIYYLAATGAVWAEAR
jgi:hypothetical protein